MESNRVNNPLRVSGVRMLYLKTVSLITLFSYLSAKYKKLFYKTTFLPMTEMERRVCVSLCMYVAMYMHAFFLRHEKVRFHDSVYELGLQH